MKPFGIQRKRNQNICKMHTYVCNNCSNQYVRAARWLVFECWAAGYELVSIQKVWNWPDPSRISAIYLCPRANAELLLNFHVVLYTSDTDVPALTLKFLRHPAVTKLSKFISNGAFEVEFHQNSKLGPNCQFISPVTYSKRPLLVALCYAIPSALPFLQFAFNRRNSGRCLWICM